MDAPRLWVRLVSALVPADERPDWVEEWDGELAASGGTMRHAWGALADAWYLRTEGWTMDSVWRDIRSAVRGMIRKPVFTALAGLTLAIGIGANTAIFSVVDGVLLNPLPFPEPDRLVSYNHEAPGLGVNVPVIPHSASLYVFYRENARALESFAVMSTGDVTFVGDAGPRQLTAGFGTEEYFDVVGAQPFLGRGWIEGEDRPDAEPVVILSHGLWEQQFGRDPSILGRLLEIDRIQRRVVGVMPAEFTVLDQDIWLPLTIDPVDGEVGSLSYIGIARLADEATVESADIEMQELLLRFAAANAAELPSSIMEQAGLTADVKPLKQLLVEDVRQVLWVLLGTVGIVLLVACANVANLFLVRAESRQREHALRRAMGASRLDIVRRNLIEAITLAVGAGALGMGMAFYGVRALLALAPAELPQALAIGIDGSVVVFTVAISLMSGLLFGLIPALGQSGRGLATTLREGGRSATSGRERLRARSGLVIAQVALALVLLVGSGLMMRSFVALQNVDHGFAAAGLMTFSFELPTVEYSEPARVLEFQRQLTQDLLAVPGVQAVGMINGLPLGGAKRAGPMEPEDRPFPEDELGPAVERRQVTAGYLETMSIRILEGRSLEWTDQADQFRGAVVSESLANTFWPAESAVGRRIRPQGAEDSWEVVGVAADVRFDDVESAPLPLIYLPALTGAPGAPEASTGMDVAIKVAGDPLSVVEATRAVLRQADSGLPMIRPRTVQSIVDDSMASASFTVVLLGIAAGVALLLGTVGIYGVVAYIVSRRTQEIGVRIALGAPTGLVLRDFVQQGLVLTGIGVGIGLLGAWAMSRALASLLYGVTATDPLTFFGTAAFLAAVSIVATWIPARRAATVDPVRALRGE